MRLRGSKPHLLIGIGLCFLLETAAGGQELIMNGNFLTNVDEWVLEFGTGHGHEAAEGHAALGAARVDGELGGVASQRQCVDVSSVLTDRFAVTGCIRAFNFEPQSVGFDIAYFASTDCSSGHMLSEQFNRFVDGQAWHLVAASLIVPPGTLAIEVLPQSGGAPANGITLFDDISLIPRTSIFMDTFQDGTLGGWSSSAGS